MFAVICGSLASSQRAARRAAAARAARALAVRAYRMLSWMVRKPAANGRFAVFFRAAEGVRSSQACVGLSMGIVRPEFMIFVDRRATR
jgi:hypothetical protein